MNLTILHLTNCYISDFSFPTLQYYTLLWIFSKIFFIITKLHITSDFFFILNILFESYNITHYFEIFFSISNYTLLQTFCFCSKHFVWTLRCYTLQLTNCFLSEFSFPTLQYYTLQTVCFILLTATLEFSFSWNLANKD